MKWKLRRIFLGDRRKSDRVLNETSKALHRLNEALLDLKEATFEQQKDQNE